MKKLFAVLALFAAALLPAGAQSNLSRVAGVYDARNYARFNPGNRVYIASGGQVAAGTSVSIPLFNATVTLGDGRTIVPYAPGVRVNIGAGASQETDTITSVNGCFKGAPQGSCTLVMTTTNAHGNGEAVGSGSYGLDEAILDAASGGSGVVNGSGGTVVIEPGWGGTSAMVTGALVESQVSVVDYRTGTPRNWNATPTGLALAVPTTLTAQAACDATHQFCSDAGVAGSASWGSSVYGCVAYVDIMGNEGPCSLTSTVFTSVASKAIDVAAPAASPGAVGYVVYLSLSGGTYAQAYQVPSTSSNCTLTTLETTTPACAVANTTYGQSASTFGADALFTVGGSQIATYPVNTGQHFTKLASTVQTTASYTPMTNSSVTYAYNPGNREGACPGMSTYNNTQGIAAGGISASSTAAIPMALGSFSIPAGCFNYVGAEFRVSGKFTWTEGGTSAATYNVLVGWDAAGTNTTTIPLAVCTIANTHTPAAAAQNGYYSCTVKILTAGATGTALVNGWGDMSIATGQALLIGFANDTAVAASGSINLTVPARITVQFTDSGNTVTGAQGLENTIEVLN